MNDLPVIDPTENVKALQLASSLRQDDLRQLNNQRIDAELRVLAASIQRLEEVGKLRAEHSQEIRKLESDRLEKIRQVDVLAGNTAADRALVAIQTLAATTTATAETLRSMVSNTATTVAAQTSETVAQLNTRIAQLEKTSYESGAGVAGEKSGRITQQQLIQWVVMLILAAIAVAGYFRR